MRDILVHANTLAPWSAGLVCAAHLAAALEASLTGVYVCPSPIAMTLSYGTPELLAYVIKSAREQEEQAFAAQLAFVNWARALGVRNATWQVAEGEVPQVLARLGNWHDLIVLERAVPLLENGPMLGQVVLASDVPCLILPPDTADPLPLDCMALAWNGSPEAMRAIHAARPLLARAKRVVLLRGTPRDTITGIGWKPGLELSDYLQRHGIRAEEQPLTARAEDAGEALLAAAKAVGASVLIMGAYGRTRFSEWIFGGATRHVLQHADVAVLMRH
jgi:nucleotide-binding universal stress UspA family protein